MYIETEKICSGSFFGELKAAGLEFGSIEWTTRRIVNGKVEKGHPRALFIAELGDEHIDTVQAVVDAHVHNFNHAVERISEVKAEAKRRIGLLALPYQRENAAALWTSLLEKRVNGDTLTQKQINQAKAVRDLRIAIDDVRTASDAIEAEIALLSDENAGLYDIVNSILWP